MTPTWKLLFEASAATLKYCLGYCGHIFWRQIKKKVTVWVKSKSEVQSDCIIKSSTSWAVGMSIVKMTSPSPEAFRNGFKLVRTVGLKSRMVKYSGVRHPDGHLALIPHSPNSERSIEATTIGKTDPTLNYEIGWWIIWEKSLGC